MLVNLSMPGRILNKNILLSNIIRPSLIILVIMIIGGLLRIFDLSSKSFWVDELLSMWHSIDIVDTKSFFTSHQGNAHPPLYFLLLKLWSIGGNGEFYLRLLSVLFGTLVIPVTYLLGKEFFKTKASILAASLVAISPFLLRFDREVRMYPLFVFLSIISIFFFIKALRQDQSKYWIGYTIVTILNTYTHYHTFLIVASMWLFFFVRFKTYKYLWKKALVSQVVIALCFCFWLPTFIVHLTNMSALGGEPTRFPTIFGFWVKPAYLFFSFSLGQTVLPWNFLIVIPGVIIFSCLFFYGIKSMLKTKETAVFFLIFLLFPILLALLISDAMPRYLVFLSPIYCLIIAYGISSISHNIFQIFAFFLVTILIGFSLVNYYQNREFHILANVDPWREVGKYLSENIKKDDQVINIGGTPLKYYAGLNVPILGANTMVTLKQMKIHETGRVWLIVSNPAHKKKGEEAIQWMNKHYNIIAEKKYYKDPDYIRKTKYFKKQFLEYRIKVYLYGKITY